MTLHLYLHPNGSLSSLNSSILSLHSLIRSSPALAARADIHLVLSPFPRAFNTWRNIARFLARTSYILLLDVDFAMCTAWRDPVRAMLQSGSEMAKRMREGRAALVLPAFEYARARDGKDQMLFPSDKQVSWRAITILAIFLTYRYTSVRPGSSRTSPFAQDPAFSCFLGAGSQQHRLRPILQNSTGGNIQSRPVPIRIRTLRYSAKGCRWLVSSLLHGMMSRSIHQIGIGVTNGSMAMVQTRQPAYLRCISRECHSTFWEITS